MSDFKVGARINRVEPPTPAISGRLSGIRFEPRRRTPERSADGPISVWRWRARQELRARMP
jgi:hypothetical protein